MDRQLSDRGPVVTGAPLSGYRGRVVRALGDPRAAKALLAEVERWLRGGGPGGRLVELRETAMLFVEMIRARVSGRYTGLPARSLVLMGAALVYLIAPVDSVPDVVPVVGLADDVAVLGWVAASLSAELTRYRTWREQAQ